MGLLDNYTGIGMAPRPTPLHQRIMLRLAIAIHNESDLDELDVLTESVVDVNNLNSPAPDVIVYDLENNSNPVFIIEITTTGECKTIRNKVEKLLKDYPTIAEGWVYDYESDKWYGYGAELDADEPLYSNLYNYMNELLD